MEALFSVPKAAEIIGVSDRFIRGMVYDHKIPFYRIGTRILFRESELEAWLQEQHTNVKSPDKPVDFSNTNKFPNQETSNGSPACE